MNNKSLRILEYPKIIQMLEGYAGSKPGKALCRDLTPSSSLEEIRSMQVETSAALSRLFAHGSLSFSGVTEIFGSLRRLEVGGTLGIPELLHLASLLETAARVKQYGRRDLEKTEEDCLESMFQALQPLTPLSTEIRRCILSEEEISDDASPGLRHVRRSMSQINGKIHNQLTSMVNGSARTYLQDAVITQRNGRYCLPVKSEHKGQIPGMIHDQSSTGSTLFIEPMAVVKLNNEMRELEIQEIKEIEAVLAGLSNEAAVHTEELRIDQLLLIRLDFIFARASFSMSYQGSEPIFNTHGYIKIKKGRHPLLNKKTVVPIDVELGDAFDLLIITGPNTGGKTVSLKTVGLLTLMGQSGLHIPAFDRSELSVFENVFADIGDEQSIEQNLSTFSSHMTNIVSILKEANERSLVLFDELGGGTDPTEGAALATAILSRLHQQGIRTMATTHYSELKVFALSTPGVENGCCEFDVETLRPTYHLLIGIPGKSNAFAISTKLGLSEDIIEEAKTHISEQSESFEDLISSLETSRVTIEREREEIARYKEEISQLKKKMVSKQDRLDTSREQILKEAHEQAHAILREAKEYADESIRKYNKLGQEKQSSREMEQERTRLRERMSSHEKGMARKQEQRPQGKLRAQDLHLGDSVKVLSLNLRGTVSSLPNAKGDLFVQMGILRSQVNIKDLILMDEPSVTGPGLQQSSTSKMKMNKSASISTEINLLGCTVDEAIAQLDKYLDDAYLSHLSSVRVVHGKGTGALRKGIHNYLRRQKHVAEYHLGEFGEGDAGVTIVTFKK